MGELVLDIYDGEGEIERYGGISDVKINTDINRIFFDCEGKQYIKDLTLLIQIFNLD